MYTPDSVVDQNECLESCKPWEASQSNTKHSSHENSVTRQVQRCNASRAQHSKAIAIDQRMHEPGTAIRARHVVVCTQACPHVPTDFIVCKVIGVKLIQCSPQILNGRDFAFCSHPRHQTSCTYKASQLSCVLGVVQPQEGNEEDVNVRAIGPSSQHDHPIHNNPQQRLTPRRQWDERAVDET